MGVKTEVRLFAQIRQVVVREGLLGLLQRCGGMLRHWLLRFRLWLGDDEVKLFGGVKVVAIPEDKTFETYSRSGYGFTFYTLLRHLGAPYTFWDFGANHGFYSLIALKNKNCKFVHAFEPNPSATNYLRHNLDANGLTEERVLVHEIAVSRSSKYDFLEEFEGHSGRSALVRSASDESLDSRNLLRVRSRNHEFLRTLFGQMTASRINILKIDVEGLEGEVIEQIAASKLFDQSHVLWVELDSKSEPSLRVEIEMNPGWRFVAKVGEGERYDCLFLNTNFLDDLLESGSRSNPATKLIRRMLKALDASATYSQRF